MTEKKDNMKKSTATEPDNTATPESPARLDTLPHLLFNISKMNQSMKAMTANTAVMRRDMGMMNQNVGRPVSFIRPLKYYTWLRIH